MIFRIFFLHRAHFRKKNDKEINIVSRTIFDFLLSGDLIFVQRIHDVVLWDAKNSHQIFNIITARILYMNPISRFPIIRLRIYTFIR